MTPIERLIDQRTCAIESYGYLVVIDPIPGEETLFAEHLREGVAKIDEVMTFNARRYRMRGRSARAMAALHRDLPEPVWGVVVASR